MSTLEFRILQSDIAAAEADVLVLKYAQNFYGADAWMASALASVGIAPQKIQPTIGQYSFVDTNRTIQSPLALFIGVQRLSHFGYQEMYEFAGDALDILARERPHTQRIALTLHGAGYGLDETASFQAELAGLSARWRRGHAPSGLKTVYLVERSASRVIRLEKALADYIARSPSDQIIAQNNDSALLLRPDNLEFPAQETSEKKNDHYAGGSVSPSAHSFVAMPFNAQMEDVFFYGIQNPVHQVDLLCERMDHITFTGEIISQMKHKIETASVVIAVLTGGNANVYLEVGYAWGKGVPTILVASNVDDLAFDVKGNRCLIYSSIKNLEEQLGKELHTLKSSGQLVHRTSLS